MLALLSSLGAAFLLTGCKGAEPAQVPPTDVNAVTVDDVVLDENATPKMVANAVLKLIDQDVEAAQSYDHEAQKAAMDKTFELAAYSTIEKRLLDRKNSSRQTKLDGLGEDRDEQLYEVVKQWAPIAAHYRASFEEASASAKENIVGDKATVLYQVSLDPKETDPEKKQTALLDVELRTEKSEGKIFWRVARLSYRSAKTPSISKNPGKQNPDDTASEPEPAANDG